ncbi:MAG TPA: sugar ABC transporter permease [Thermoanaerobaculia bacterium]
MTSSRRSVPSWRALTLAGALLLIGAVFFVATHGTFASPRNLALLARQMSVTALLAVGMVLVIVTGEIDLSVGAMSGLLGAVATIASVNAGWPLAAAFPAALVLGAALGLAQGTLVARLHVPSFIVTLGGMLVFQGTLLGVTGGISISPGEAFLRVGQAYLGRAAGWALAGAAAAAFLVAAARVSGSSRARRIFFAAASVAFTALMNAYVGIPLPVLLLVAVAAAFSTIANHTAFGRRLYAIGGNREAALYSGVSIERHVSGVFTLMGLLCGAAGIVLTARVGSATSDAGRLMELDAIAAAVIGGTSLLGGRGTVWGALLGALVMASLDNGMSLMNTEPYWQPILKGAILVAAVAADVAGRRPAR